MNKSLRGHAFDTQQANGFLVSLQIFENILHWLAGFMQLTEEEREAAGIYLGDQHSR
jgi:hypothetical protein